MDQQQHKCDCGLFFNLLMGLKEERDQEEKCFCQTCKMVRVAPEHIQKVDTWLSPTYTWINNMNRGYNQTTLRMLFKQGRIVADWLKEQTPTKKARCPWKWTNNCETKVSFVAEHICMHCRRIHTKTMHGWCSAACWKESMNQYTAAGFTLPELV